MRRRVQVTGLQWSPVVKEVTVENNDNSLSQILYQYGTVSIVNNTTSVLLYGK